MTLAPVDVPANSPSSRARRSAIALASSVETGSIRSATSRRPERNDEAGADPVDLVGARRPPDRTGDSAGSTATTLIRSVAAQRLGGARAGRPRCRRSARSRRSALRSAPDLVRQRVIRRQLVRVVQLVGPEASGFRAMTRAASTMSRVSFSVIRPPSLRTI